jgi:hypothetical protein
MPSLDDPVDHILSLLEKVQKNSKGYTALCPAHDDRRNSLSIATGEDGRVLLHCFAGCQPGAIVSALELSMTDLFPPKPATGTQNGRVQRRCVTTYDYRDEAGALLYQVVRFEPKAFRQRRPDGKGGWVWNLDGVRRVPYRLSELLAADPWDWVLIVEGEKDADRLADLGYVVTTNVGGAGKWRSEYGEFFRSRPICILHDNDEPGETHAARVAQSLQLVAASMRVLRLPDLLAKGDVSDWLDTGGTKEELDRLIAEAPLWKPTTRWAQGKADGTNQDSLEAVGIKASDVRPEHVSFLWPGRLAAGKFTMVDGDPGLGKSTCTLDIAARITRGWPLPGCEGNSEPRGVVLMSAEDGMADTIVPRLRAAGADLGRVFILRGIKGADGEEDPVTIPDGIPTIEQAIVTMDAALLIIDPLMAYFGTDVNPHRDSDVRRALAPLARILERTGCAALLVRHLTKAEAINALYRGGGSIGIIGAARFGLLVAKDPEDDEARILAPTKCNIGPEPPALRYRLESTPGSDAARVIWDAEPVTINASELLAAADDASRSERDEARDWMKDFLAGSAKPAHDVLKAGRIAGFTDITLRRAKKALGVVSTKSGFGCEGKWAWSLPDHELASDHSGIVTNPPKVINEPRRRSSQEGEHLRQEVIILGQSLNGSAGTHAAGHPDPVGQVPIGCGKPEICGILGPCPGYQNTSICPLTPSVEREPAA